MTDYWHNQAGVPVVGNQKKKKKTNNYRLLAHPRGCASSR